MLLIGVAALGMVTAMIVAISRQTYTIIPRATMDTEISTLLGQSAALQGAIEQMIANGADPKTLYSDLSLWKPGEVTDGSPNMYRIYSPLGGGIKYLAASSDSLTPVADSFNIARSSIVEDVGPTDAGGGPGGSDISDIMFVARVTSASYCARINEILTGSTVVPLVDDAEDFIGTVAVTIGDSYGNCVGCIGKARLCIRDAGNTFWGFYSVLLPG